MPFKGKVVVVLQHQGNDINVILAGSVRKYCYIVARVENVEDWKLREAFVEEYENFLERECKFDTEGYLIEIPVKRKWDLKDFVGDGVLRRDLLRKELDGLKERKICFR